MGGGGGGLSGCHRLHQSDFEYAIRTLYNCLLGLIIDTRIELQLKFRHYALIMSFLANNLGLITKTKGLHNSEDALAQPTQNSEFESQHSRYFSNKLMTLRRQ